jgi:hypothetical protein
MFWADTCTHPRNNALTFQVSVGTLLTPLLALDGIGQALKFHCSAIQARGSRFLKLGERIFLRGDWG